MKQFIARPTKTIGRLIVVVLASSPARFVITKPRTWITTLLEIAGFGAIVAGFFRISTTAGLMATGAALLLIGWLEA